MTCDVTRKPYSVNMVLSIDSHEHKLSSIMYKISLPPHFTKKNNAGGRDDSYICSKTQLLLSLLSFSICSLTLLAVFSRLTCGSE